MKSLIVLIIFSSSSNEREKVEVGKTAWLVEDGFGCGEEGYTVDEGGGQMKKWKDLW